MLIALLSKPTTHKVEGADIKPKKAFKKLHQPGVDKDFRDAASRGIKRLIVTPKRIVLSRRPDSSRVRVDLSAGSQQERWLKQLYRKSCPPDMTVRFNFEIHYGATCGDHLEDIYMLVVIFDKLQ